MCFGDSALVDCGVCDGDGASCAPFDCGISDLVAIGGMNEVFLQWGACEGATSYNVYRDGVHVGTTSETSYVDPESGFGLDYMTEYCYTVTTTNVSDLEGPHSGETSATTLPYVLAGLDVSVDPTQGLIYVSMVNFWYISGYQFDVSIEGDAGELVGVGAVVAGAVGIGGLTCGVGTIALPAVVSPCLTGLPALPKMAGG